MIVSTTSFGGGRAMGQRTVVGIIRCRPGRIDDVVQKADERYQARSASRSGRLDSYLFEDRADPCLFISVSRWESRAAFETVRRQLGVIGGADLYEAEPTLTFYQPLLRYVQVLSP